VLPAMVKVSLGLSSLLPRTLSIRKNLRGQVSSTKEQLGCQTSVPLPFQE